MPTTTLQPVPPERAFRFLGNPGEETYLLPQAVLGNHVHGELDPHFWHDVAAVKAVVKVVRDELSTADPAHAGHGGGEAVGMLLRRHRGVHHAAPLLLRRASRARHSRSGCRRRS